MWKYDSEVMHACRIREEEKHLKGVDAWALLHLNWICCACGGKKHYCWSADTFGTICFITQSILILICRCWKHYGRLLLLLVLPAINIKNMRTLNTYIIATIYTYIAVHLSKKTILIPIFLVNQNRTFRLVWNFISFCELWYMKFCYNYFKQKHRKKNAKMNEK